MPDRTFARHVPEPARYFLGLGSNLGDRETTLRSAWDKIGALCSASRFSRIYETAPLYVEDQPRYLNAVGEAWSDLEPAEMLAELQRIEAAFGRNRAREVRRGPRTLDVDILLCGQTIIQSSTLVLPHPLMTERLFVLVPLLELDPELVDPRTGMPFQTYRRSLDSAPGSGGGVYLHTGDRYTDASKT